jgi:hypothetical protein
MTVQVLVRKGNGYQNRKRCTRCDLWVPLIWLKCRECNGRLRTKRRNLNKLTREKRDSLDKPYVDVISNS